MTDAGWHRMDMHIKSLGIEAECVCHACIEEHNICAPHMPGWKLSSIAMILCPTCGNKRCPHASDHRLACTGSNDSGQKGSVYE